MAQAGDEVFEEGFIGNEYVFYLIITMPVILLLVISLLCTACYFRGRSKGNSQEAFLPSYVNVKQMKKSDKTGCMYMIYNLGFQRGRKMAFDEGTALPSWQIRAKVQRRMSIEAETNFKVQKEQIQKERRQSWRASIDMTNILPQIEAKVIKELARHPDDSLAMPEISPGSSGTTVINLNNGTFIRRDRRASNADLQQICENLEVWQL